MLKMGCIFSAASDAVLLTPTAASMPGDTDKNNGAVIGENMQQQEYSPACSPECPRSNQFISNIVVENALKNINDFYEFEDTPLLGSGISGTVRVCVHKLTRVKYALKTLNKHRVNGLVRLQRLREEVYMMGALDHPHIVRVHEVFESDQDIFVVMDLCRGGELLDRLHEQRGSRYSEREACRYVHTMLGALRYCHSHNIVHRDLKLENFLFEDRGDDAVLKLIDFGLSRHFRGNEVMHRSVGTPYYISPEVLAGNYNSKCDVWSIGVIAYMLLSGTPPFYGKNDDETFAAVRRGKWRFCEPEFRSVSAQGKAFIIACLTRRVEARPSADVASRHPWFNLLKTAKEPSASSISIDVIERMQQFQRRSTVSKVCMEAVAHCLLPNQIRDLRTEFAKYDLRQRGEISHADLRTVLGAQTMALSEGEIQSIFEGVDIDHAGVIQYHEFLAAAMSQHMVTEENLRLAFERIGNRNECITGADLCVLLSKERSGAEVAEIEREIQSLRLEQIDFKQFKKIMQESLTSPLSSRGLTLSTKESFAATSFDGDGGDDDYDYQYAAADTSEEAAMTLSPMRSSQKSSVKSSISGKHRS